MPGIDLELRMMIKTMAERGTSCSEICHLLKLPESNVRHHLHRIRAGAADGRVLRPRRAAVVAEAIAHWILQRDGAPISFPRLSVGGLPVVIRVNDDTAAISHSAGPCARLSEPYRRYALTVRFHVDLCVPCPARRTCKLPH